MGLLRGRRDERRDDPGDSHYRMQEKMFSIGDDYWIETGLGRRAFKVDGKALRIRRTCIIEDPAGREVYKVQEKELRVRDTMDVERGGDTVATVKKALVNPLRDRFSIDVHGGQDMEAHGNIVDHEYKIERDGTTVAEVSKRWFRVRDTYGIEVEDGEDAPFLLAVSVCIDNMSRG